MKISTKGRYAIEALTYMASLPQDAPIKITKISDYTKISVKYLEQIYFRLRKEQILTTKRGAKGGYLFLKDINALTAGEIIRAVEGDLSPVACLEDMKHCKSRIKDCSTRNIWMDIHMAVEDVLNHITLQDLKNYFLEKAGEQNENIH